MWPFDSSESSVSDDIDSILSQYQDPDLEAIISNLDTDPKARSLATGLQTSLNKIHSVGLDPELAKPRSSLFMDILDTLDAPRQGVAGVIDAYLRGDIGNPDVGTGWRRGQTENITTSDILRRNHVIENPILRGIAGFAGDVLTDPLMYVGAPVLKGVSKLSDAGQALRLIAESKMVGQGLDAAQIGTKLDEAETALRRYFDAAENWGKAKNPNVAALEADTMAKSEKIFSPVYNIDEIPENFFAPRKLKVGIQLPFVGHLQEDKKLIEEVRTATDKSNPIVQALKGIGEVFKPGFVGTEIPISDEFINVINNAKNFTAEKLADVGKVITGLPLVGKPAELIGKATKGLSDLFKETFRQKAIIGGDAARRVLEMKEQRRFAAELADEEALKVVGPYLDDMNRQREVILNMDKWAGEGAQFDTKTERAFLEKGNRLARTDKIDEADIRDFQELVNKPNANGIVPEQLFRTRYKEMMADPTVDEGVKDLTTRVMNHFDELALKDADLGLGTYLEYYFPHKYLNKGTYESGFQKAGSFLKPRKYSTLKEAFELGDKIPELDLFNLVRGRTYQSHILSAQKNFWNRLVVENGVPAELVQKLAKEAIADPRGEAAQALKRYHVPFKPATAEDIAKRQETSKLFKKDAADFENSVHLDMLSSGIMPKDRFLPAVHLSELGELVKEKGMANVILPKPIAKAFNETVAAKDILRDTIGATPFGKAMLAAMDHVGAAFRKIVTLPFPAYWAQNWLGDRFNTAMDELKAFNPGVLGRAYDLSAGKTALVNKVTGLKLTGDVFNKALKQAGIHTTSRDLLNAVDTFGKMNIEKFTRSGYSKFQNLFSREKGSKAALLSQLHDSLNRQFDGMYRAAHVVHRFEQGDTLPEAIRAAQDLYFNYKDMSPIESSLFRRFFMFYGYMSKATKQTVTNLITNPGNLNLQLSGARALSEFFSDPNAAPTMEQFDMNLLNSAVNAEQISRVIGKTPEGKAIVGRGFSAPLNQVLAQFSAQTPHNFTVGELANAAMDSGKRTIQKMFAASNPVINAAAQAVSGKNLYFDKPLDAEFLRKIPSLNAAAERLAGLKHNELPVDLDAVTKTFLGAVPDGKGRLIADPGKMWVLMNLVPGLSRATSMAGTFTNLDIPTKSAILRNLVGVNLSDTDLSRSYLSSMRENVDRFMSRESVRQRLSNLEEEQGIE